MLTFAVLTSALAAAPAVVGSADNPLPVVPAGFKVELFVREPLVRNPCAMAFDARGRLFVGQGPQYRSPKPDTPGDTIRILVDADGDGTAESATTFASGFNCIQGMAWRGRDLWVANSPDLTVVRDLDGDDVADEYVLVYTDLGNIEHGLHGLNWAPDGKLYMSKGNSKGLTQPGRIAPKPFRELWDVTAPEGSPDFPAPRVFKRDGYRRTYHDPKDDWGRMGGILRCDDLGANLEIVARGFRNPVGIGYDSAFNWLGTDNDQSGGDRIFMPFFGADFGWSHAWSSHWTGEGHLPTVPVSGPVFHGSGTGIVYYDAAQMPETHRDVWFICDWLQKAVYLYRPNWDGALLVPDGGKLQEFIRGTNALFKPVDIVIGPDGALYISGWGNSYGAVWEKGEQANEGRVFRISHAAAPAARPPQRPDPIARRDFREVFADLGSAIPARRIEAQDEIVRRGAAIRGVLLETIRRGGLTTSQETWALWTLGRLEPQNPEIDAWLDSTGHSLSANARLQSIRIAAHRIREWRKTARLPAFVAEALSDPEPRVRFAAVQAVGQARQMDRADAMLELLATETDRITFYAAWNALLEIMPLPALRQKLEDRRAGVRRGALLALLRQGAVEETRVRALLKDSDPSIAELAALWLAKRNNNPLITIEPAPGEFTDRVRVNLSAGVKPGILSYTIDGSEPTASGVSPRPLVLTDTTTVKAALFIDGKKIGRTVVATWHKRGPSGDTETLVLTPPREPTTLAQVRPLLAQASAERGHRVFVAAGCVACHRVGTEGGIFGPDLTQLGERGDVERVIRSVLEPSAEVTEGFSLLSITTRDGKSFAGRLQEETGNGIALVLPDGQTLWTKRADIAKKESLHTSPMPPYDRALQPQDAADLVRWLVTTRSPGDSAPPVPSAGLSAEVRDDSVVITDAGKPVAVYVFKDADTLRPYFKNLYAPGGTLVTRPHPPSGEGNDHPGMHPGVWFGFGGINGEDFWRNRGRIVHEHFIEPPIVKSGVLSFTTANRLFTRTGEPFAMQILRARLVREPEAYVLTCETTIKSDKLDLVFSQQEEMGFGVRLAPMIRETKGGVVRNSEGVTGAKNTWGRVADWVSYSRASDGRVVGAAILAAPSNPQRSWWHTRDYGLMLANPFGLRVLPPGSDGLLTIKRGDALTLCYRVLLYDAASAPDIAAAFREFTTELNSMRK